MKNKKYLAFIFVLIMLLCISGCVKEVSTFSEVAKSAQQTEEQKEPQKEPQEEAEPIVTVVACDEDAYGSKEEMFFAESYVLLRGKLVDVYLDKDVKWRGSSVEDIETVMRTIEEVTGLSYYPENDKFVKAGLCVGNRKLFWGANPFLDYPENDGKVQLLVAIDRNNEGISSCATGTNCIVYVSDTLDLYEGNCAGVIIHELMHNIQERNSNILKTSYDKICEGYAAFHEHIIAEKLPEFSYSEMIENQYSDFCGTLNAETAEEICNADVYSIYGNFDEEYNIGYAMVEYMIDNGGEERFNLFLEAVYNYLNDPYTVCTVEGEKAALKSVYGEDFYEKFGAWYSSNHVCTNKTDSIYGVRLAKENEYSFEIFHNMLLDAEPGTTVSLDRTALVSPNYSVVVPEDVTLSIEENGLIEFSSEHPVIFIGGVLKVPDFSFYLGEKYMLIYIENGGILKTDEFSIENVSSEDEHNTVTLIVYQEGKAELCGTRFAHVSCDKKGGEKRFFEMFIMDSAEININGKIVSVY